MFQFKIRKDVPREITDEVLTLINLGILYSSLYQHQIAAKYYQIVGLLLKVDLNPSPRIKELFAEMQNRQQYEELAESTTHRPIRSSKL